MMNPASLANLRNAPPFKPGESGNKRGSSRGYRRVLKAAREASPEAMQTLIACMRDKTALWNERIRACDIILDRAWGTEAKIDLDLVPERVTSILIEIAHMPAAPAAPAAPEPQQQLITIDSSPVSESVDP